MKIGQFLMELLKNEKGDVFMDHSVDFSYSKVLQYI